LSRPLILLVDDSEVVLVYAREALSSTYEVVSAKDGEQGLQMARALLPRAIVLDLSMPRMDGEQMLRLLREDPLTAQIPVVLASSEQQRGQQLLSRGAQAFLGKPVRAEELRAAVGQILEEVERDRLARSVAVLPVAVGSTTVGLRLDDVRGVLLQPATAPLPARVGWITDLLVLHGAPVPVMDLGRPLRSPHQVPLPERKLVLVQAGEIALALSVDRVCDPELFGAGAVRWRRSLASALLPSWLLGIVDWKDAPLALLEVGALVSPRHLATLRSALSACSLDHPAGAP
jgi:CheY-like chemotaxis protein/chemotaxis signal transduction protein